MSYIQQITLKKHYRKGLSKDDDYQVDEIFDLGFLPLLPDQDSLEFFSAELSLGYLEFHKVFELDEIIKNTAMDLDGNEYEIGLDHLQNIIGEFRMLIDKQKDDETKNYWLSIERKLSDLFQIEDVVNYKWQIIYWHEG